MGGNKERRSEIELAAGAVGGKLRFGDMTDQGPAIQAAIEKGRCYARHDSPVLIMGETGTGKEIWAHSIHYEGFRSAKPFVPVNCSAIPPELFENEFFGHVRGAFTGAGAGKPGFFEQAHGGTLFLDEINSLALLNQPKLLRALQEHECRRLGDTVSRRFDVRVISASNCDLKEEARAGRFRPDLYYRLAVLEQTLPPLRQHTEDIPLLAHQRIRYLISKRNAERNGHLVTEELAKLPTSFTPAALKKMMEYAWPGNVRQLESEVERAFILSKGPEIDAHDLHLDVGTPLPAGESLQAQTKRAKDDFERRKLKELLDISQGNISKAARLGGKNRRAFFQLLRKHHLTSKSTASAAARTH